jgi:hypothetical protein
MAKHSPTSIRQRIIDFDTALENIDEVAGPLPARLTRTYARLRGTNRRFSSGWIQGLHVWLHHATLTGRLELCT